MSFRNLIRWIVVGLLVLIVLGVIAFSLQGKDKGDKVANASPTPQPSVTIVTPSPVPSQSLLPTVPGSAPTQTPAPATPPPSGSSGGNNETKGGQPSGSSNPSGQTAEAPNSPQRMVIIERTITTTEYTQTYDTDTTSSEAMAGPGYAYAYAD